MSEAISVQHGAFGRAALYSLDRPFVTHAHREAHFVFYVAGTPGTVRVSGTPHTTDPISGIGISPWEPHSFEVTEGGGSALCLVLYIRPDWFMEVDRAPGGDFSLGRTQIALTPDTARWVHRLGDMLHAGEDTGEVETCVYEAASRCYRLSWRGMGRAENAMTSIDRRVSRALGLMGEHFTGEVEIDWLAREAGLSRPHFFKLFKHEVGVTPNIYLNTLRSERAIDDLLLTPKSVTEIGYDLGFSSQASFTRFFAANVGIPPSEYRRVSLAA